MNVFFIIDNKEKSGLGHIQRCLLISDELIKKKVTVYFIGYKKFFKKNINFILLKKNLLKNNLNYIKNLINKKKPKFIIFDTYEINQTIINCISEMNTKIMVIHDYKFYKKNVDIYLNYNFNKIKYKNNNFLLGSKFAIIKKNLLNNRVFKKNLKKILIFFGGRDSNNLNFKMIKIINNNFFKKFKFTIILGPNVRFKSKILSYVKSLNKNIDVFDDKFQKKLLNADLFIGTGGSALWDVAITKTPAIICPINLNQDILCKSFKKNIFLFKDLLKNKDITILRKKLINYFNQYNSFKFAARLKIKLLDHNGTARVAKHILKYDRTKITV
jgi:spore coat polysaccharide biosynthesis predicted glycosyltransferase SpsG